MILRLLVGLAVIGALAAAGAWELQRRWSAPLNIGDEGYFLTVDAGETLRSVAEQLQRDGVFADPWLLRGYGRWSGADQKIRRGEYRVPPGTTPAALLLLLERGKVIHYQVTLPEGITLAAALAVLGAQEPLRHELDGPNDPRLLELVKPAESAEGQFFPDTYHYDRGASDWQILQRAYDAMQQALAEEWSERAAGLPYETPYEALIMASIIERETGLDEERGEIAGVFVRRLQKGMRLQTDPTVIYGLGPAFDGNLTRRHLADESNPFNTYRHGGLPPAPIALPGRASIRAALQPEDGDALFFVARGDGGHVFSATLAEHERAVRKYQLSRREDYRSSPGKQ
ncbi:MAG: endolytic transglycosylase MltG [Halioglobus sp.]|jgi:UPF0755 protein